jgi:hypothetical protein
MSYKRLQPIETLDYILANFPDDGEREKAYAEVENLQKLAALRRPVDREALAEYAHKAWSGWMAYLFEKSALNQDGTVTIPLWAVERWLRQMSTEYKDLTDIEKSTDIYEADAIMDLIGRSK